MKIEQLLFYTYDCNNTINEHERKYLLSVLCHYSGVIMAAVASPITSLTIVYWTVYSGADKKKPSKLRITGLCAVTGEFPAQRASNAEMFPFDDVIMPS